VKERISLPPEIIEAQVRLSLDGDHEYNSPPMQKRVLPSFYNSIIILLIFVLGSLTGFQYAAGRFGKLPFLPIPLSQQKLLPGKLVNSFQPEEFKEIDFQQFWEVWKTLEQNYVDPEKIDPEKMVDGAIEGLTRGLEDPYTFYLPPEQKQRTDEDLAGSFYGVGIQLGYVDQTLAVMTPLKGSPAETAGIRAQDLILHVKDKSKDLDVDTQGWTLTEAVNYIRGKRGTEVTLTLYRKDNGAEPFDVTIKRDEIVVPSVEHQLVGAGVADSVTTVTKQAVVDGSTLGLLKNGDKTIGYIRVSTFNERTKDEWDSAVKDILTQSEIDGLIIDFRNNPGGLLERAIELASDFFAKGVVVTQQGRYTNKPFQSMGTARLANYPVVVLVNKGSASASEIVAGALRDQIKAKLVGEKTFGKGTVQDRIELNNGGALHVTIAKWLLPGGAWIHHEGIPVDVEVKDNLDTPEDEVILEAVKQF